jgi:GR25 family glycosyltransferase involved in LPS biosynthesis
MYVFPWGGRSVLAGWKRNSFIETVVTDKHIRAWSAFLESDADFMICFEDDAVFKDDSTQRLNELLDDLARRLPDILIYVDLAGGCERDMLKIDTLETGRDASFRFYRKPVTNTACSYLMSRPLVTIFIEMIVRRPWLRLIGIDWMMNKLFILAANDGIECSCMHASPTIFKHGSFTGEYKTWNLDHKG